MEAQEFSDIDETEKTVKNGEMDSELAELERNARIAGEVAEQEKEVENMLAQLEGIRNKLRAGRGGEPEEEEPARKPTAPKAAPAKKSSSKKKSKKK